ncbi:hypothetical protein ACWGNE_08090 [Streptomyces xiamenensis]
MLSEPVLAAACVGAAAAVTCCVCLCVTVARIVTVALRGSRPIDRPEIIRAVTHLIRELLRRWWLRRK